MAQSIPSALFPSTPRPSADLNSATIRLPLSAVESALSIGLSAGRAAGRAAVRAGQWTKTAALSFAWQEAWFISAMNRAYALLCDAGKQDDTSTLERFCEAAQRGWNEAGGYRNVQGVKPLATVWGAV